MPTEKPHTERWAYRMLYRDNIFELCTRLYSVLRRPGLQAVARSVAWTYAVTQPAIRKIVRDNLSLLQKQPATDADAIRTFVNYGSTIADYVAVGAMSEEQALRLCLNDPASLEHLSLATQGGKGAILATAHFSFFEFGAVMLQKMGIPITVATLPEPSRELTEWRAKWRQRWGGSTVEIGADPFSSVQVIRALEEGHCMAMLADRPLPVHGLPVDLPNGRIHFSTAPAILAAITGCSVIPVTVRRTPEGLYHLVAQPAINVPRCSREERRAEIERCTRAIAASLFSEISRAPDQWYQFVPVGL